MFRYAIALGSNRRHGRYGGPRGVVDAGITALDGTGSVTARSAILPSPAMGPAGRDFANAVAIVESEHGPVAMLAALKRIEQRFGRRRGRRWGQRVLDLDIVLWSGGRWRSRDPWLEIPHPGLRHRPFVLRPLLEIAPDWRLPGTALGMVHIAARLTRDRPRHRSRPRSGP